MVSSRDTSDETRSGNRKWRTRQETRRVTRLYSERPGRNDVMSEKRHDENYFISSLLRLMLSISINRFKGFNEAVLFVISQLKCNWRFTSDDQWAVGAETWLAVTARRSGSAPWRRRAFVPGCVTEHTN